MKIFESTPVRLAALSIVVLLFSGGLCGSGACNTVIENSVTIDAPPDEVFGYFEHMNNARYLAWHPGHKEFHYVQGDKIEEGAVGYFDEKVGVERHRMEVRYTKVVPDEKIVFVPRNRFTRLLYPHTKMTFEAVDGGTRFTQTTTMRVPLEWLPDDEHTLEHGRRHTREEGENLKRLIEEDEVPER